MRRYRANAQRIAVPAPGNSILFCSGSFQELQATRVQPVRQLDIVRMVLIGQAQSGKAPRIFQVGIEGKTVRFEGSEVPCPKISIVRVKYDLARI